MLQQHSDLFQRTLRKQSQVVIQAFDELLKERFSSERFVTHENVEPQQRLMSIDMHEHLACSFGCLYGIIRPCDQFMYMLIPTPCVSVAGGLLLPPQLRGGAGTFAPYCCRHLSVARCGCCDCCHRHRHRYDCGVELTCMCDCCIMCSRFFVICKFYTNEPVHSFIASMRAWLD